MTTGISPELGSRAAEFALDRLSRGVIIADQRLGVVFGNHIARAILARRDGLRLVDRSLSANPPDAAELKRLVRQGGMMIVARLHHQPLQLLVSPLESGRVVIFISDPDASPHIDERILRQLYGLTAAEAKFACSWVDSLSVKKVTRTLAVSVHTSRTHLRRIFAKTNTHSQSELVRLLLSGICTLR